MSCRIELQAVSSAPVFAKAAATVEAETRRIEAHFSRYRPDSMVSRINQAAGKQAVVLDAETAALLDFADHCYRASGGVFDITSGALRQLWAQAGSLAAPLAASATRHRLPDAAALARVCALIGWEKLVWQRAHGETSIFLPQPGMEIDLGGLGKEYAADRAATLLRQQGLSAALLNFGGDLHACGPWPDGSPWQVGIAHPRQPGALLATLPLFQGGLASSGDYARCLLIDGVRYSHLFDPRSGYPVRGLASATVLADTCLVAGALASIALLHGAAGGDFLASAASRYLAVDDAGRQWQRR